MRNNSIKNAGFVCLGIIVCVLSYSTVSLAESSSPNTKQLVKEKKPYGSDMWEGTELPIPSDLMLMIRSYDYASRTYTVGNASLPGEGDFFVAPETLARSVGALKIEKLRERPRDIVGFQYMTDSALPTFADAEIKKRAEYYSRAGKARRGKSRN